MVKNNKGFTMVEMVVSIAIFGILSLGIMNFMTTGANLFSTVNTGLSLQYESQTAMAQLQEYIIDANYSVEVNATGDVVTVVNKVRSLDADGNPESNTSTGDPIFDYTWHVFSFDATAETLYYSTATSEDVTTPGNFSAGAIVCKNVSAFNVVQGAEILVTDEDLDGDGEDDSFNRLDTITYTLTLEKHGRNNVASQDLFLRNKPIRLPA